MPVHTQTNSASGFTELRSPIQATLSIVVPAHQEAKRITDTLERYISFLSSNCRMSEIIVVCNGCTDGTAEIAQNVKSKGNCEIRVIETEERGKGIATRIGVLSAAHDYIFFTDADSAYAPELLSSFVDRLTSGYDVVIAGRMEKAQYSSIGRRILGSASGLLLTNFFTPGIADTQAGFKGFSRRAAHLIFPEQKINGFAFDIELLMLAKKAGLPVSQLFVPWTDCPGSKVRVAKDAVLALAALLSVSLRLKLHNPFKKQIVHS